MAENKKCFGLVDWFRLPAALMVIAIHTAPFASVCPVLDVVLTYGLSRIAVPFFLMTTGYFVLGHGDNGTYVRFLKKTLVLYTAAVLLYVPVMWYAGKLPEGPLKLLKMLVFDGTFYHLWYFPALILGSLLVKRILGVCSPGGAAAVTGILYLIGLLGDSYYGLVERVPVLHSFYEGLFQISSYTRNGIFYAPLFLFLGAALGKRGAQKPGPKAAAGLAAAVLLLLAESYLTDDFGLQRHNSMYLALPVVMYLFYPFLLQGTRKAPDFLREGTAFLYVIHPIAVILVRGAAGVLGLRAVLVEQSLVHYGAVVLLSLFLMVYELYILRAAAFLRRKAVRTDGRI